MTKAQIDAQIEAIEKGTKIITKSKESALEFLINAGIVKPEKKLSVTKAKK